MRETATGLSFDVTTGTALAAADGWTAKTDQNVSEFGVFSDGAKGKGFNRQSAFSFNATASGLVLLTLNDLVPNDSG